jgi:DNA-binding Xre family transcriptional regulator
MSTSNEVEKLEFGKNVLFWMKKRKLSYGKLAILAEMEKSHIQSIVKGNYDVRLSTIMKLSTALQVTPNDLIPYDSINDQEK